MKKRESADAKAARLTFYEEVLSKGRCFFKGLISHPCAKEGEIMDPMHFIPKQTLYRIATLRGYTETETLAMVWDVRNGAPGCRPLHTRMDRKLVRIYQSQLPEEVFDFVRDWRLENELNRYYPEGAPEYE